MGQLKVEEKRTLRLIKLIVDNIVNDLDAVSYLQRELKDSSFSRKAKETLETWLLERKASQALEPAP
jgi:hypothetical protein